MPGQPIKVAEASRRARRRLQDVIADLRAARRAAGLSQATLAAAVGCSRQLISEWESAHILPDPIQLAAWAAVVGLEVSIGSFPAGSPLRDAGQLRLMARARAALGEQFTWRTEVPVSDDPRDRRAFDAVLSGGVGRIGLEAITRLTDAQGQVRAATLKQAVARLDRVVLVLAETRHNRAVVLDAAPTLQPAFPEPARAILHAIRAGELPSGNGIVLL